MNAGLERIREARRCLERVHGKLLRPSPSAFDESAGEVNTAVACLEQTIPQLGSLHTADPILRWEVAALQRELLLVTALLEGARRFYEGWARLMAPPEDAPPSYDAAGREAAIASIDSRKLVIHG